MIRKGIILAAGRGTRLYPATIVIGKPLLPIFDKPMVYYSLCTLMQAQIRDICIVTNPHDLEMFKELLGNGDNFGISIEYKIQYEPKGIADVFNVAKDFIKKQACALVLGDNLFIGSDWSKRFIELQKTNINGAHVFGFPVQDPNRYGVMAFNQNNQLVDIIEKPVDAPSNIAVTGLYFYDEQATEMASLLKPSARGELEISDLNRMYLAQKNLDFTLLSASDDQWYDIGTHESMYRAIDAISTYIFQTHRQVGCIEEIAYLNGWINEDILQRAIEKCSSTAYGKYLECLSRVSID